MDKKPIIMKLFEIEVVRTYTNMTSKVKSTLDTSTELMEQVLERLDDGRG